ncbi:MAG: HAD family hydrolase [Planctomycetota bacterium]|jgi:D-glycero-D-manno-heptose 1,7-bisphosphate phosphatase|nr:HAD family hydrolase [Planctomycetota bacterium]
METGKHKRKRYVLLDRDGTIMVDKAYQSDPALTELLPGALAGLRTLSDAGYRLVVITNQSGINRGLIKPRELEAVNQSLVDLLAKEGIAVERVYYCPHTPEDGCNCRKPRPGMALRAAEELGFDTRDAYVIGDREADMRLGKAVGATSVLVRTGGGRETEESGNTAPDYIADDLANAATWMAARA